MTASRVLPGEVVNPAPLGWRVGDRREWRLIDEPGPLDAVVGTAAHAAPEGGTVTIEFTPIR